MKRTFKALVPLKILTDVAAFNVWMADAFFCQECSALGDPKTVRPNYSYYGAGGVEVKSETMQEVEVTLTLRGDQCTDTVSGVTGQPITTTPTARTNCIEKK